MLMLQAIEALPLMQTPEVFGLHANADIQYYSNATKDLWKNLIELQPRVAGSGGGTTRDDFIKQTAQDILNVIPDPFEVHVIKKEIGVPSPTQIVLLQELERWNQCASLAHSVLQ
jgi:dynein heavy chain, axonemal